MENSAYYYQYDLNTILQYAFTEIKTATAIGDSTYDQTMPSYLIPYCSVLNTLRIIEPGTRIQILISPTLIIKILKSAQMVIALNVNHVRA